MSPTPASRPMWAWTVVALLLVCTVYASHAPPAYRRSRNRAQVLRTDIITTVNNTHSLVERAAPSGWSVYTKSGNDGGGCYIDSSSARILTGYTVTDSKNGLQSCLTTCKNKGFAFAGVQYGTQCYCGASLPSTLASAPSSECNAACKTTSTDKCGGTWRMNVYTTGAASSVDLGGYILQGCVSDGPARALTGYSFKSSKMTVKSCVDACSSRGMALAGVEYGQECYCGASLANGLGLSLDASKCDRKCVGDGGSNCGGSYTMSLYSKSAVTIPTTNVPTGWKSNGCVQDTNGKRVLTLQSTSATMTIATCLSNCEKLGSVYAGVENGNECFCGKQLNGGVSLDESKCNVPCKGGSTSSCGGSWALSIYQSTTTPVTTTTATTTTASPSPSAPSSSSPPAGWAYVQCGTDSEQRALNGANYIDQAITVNKCLSYCSDKGFKIGGVQVGAECWCGNSLLNGMGKKVSDSECSSACGGDGSKGRCGGDWRISFFSTLTGSALTSAFNPTTTTSTTITAATTAATTVPTSTPGGVSYTPTTSIPGSGTKYVWAHFIVGNAYPYTFDHWTSNIRLASANGIDGFVLNMGPDSWQPARIKDAYDAAAASNTGFKMMLSFDIAEFNCGDGSRIGLFQQYIRDFLYHPAAAKVNGKQAVTTFMGQDCSFGQGSTNNGWATIFGSNMNNIYFMPAYTSDPRALGQYNIQASVNWGSAWPEGANEINLDRDNYFIGLLSQTGKKYIGTVSPLFASHMSYKNYIWRGDNWLLAQKFEQMISIRDKVDQLEVVSWNDYGESSYIGPIDGDMPSDVRYYVNNNFPHEDILSLVNFYSTAWKSGRWPAITKDQVWIMARPHAKYGASGGYGAPQGRDFTQDNFYAQVHLTADASVTLCAGACTTQAGKAGINRFSQPMTAGQGISVEIKRGGQVTTRLSPSFTFQGGADRPNFNYLIKSS